MVAMSPRPILTNAVAEHNGLIFLSSRFSGPLSLQEAPAAQFLHPKEYNLNVETRELQTEQQGKMTSS